jgi:HEAT repeat protein
MATPDTLAAQLARCVERFRDADAKTEQKAEFRALLTLLETEPLTLRDDGGTVTVNGSRVDGPAVASLVQRLALHGVVEITVPQAPRPAEVFDLVRALASQPGIDDVPAKLQVAGTGRVSVTLAAAAVPSQPAAPPPPPKRASGLGTEGILRGEPMTDIASPDVRVAGVPSITHDPPPPSPESALPARGNVKPSGALPKVAQSSGPPAFAPPPQAPPSPPPPSPSPPPPAAPAAEARPSALAADEALLAGAAPAGGRAQTTDTLLRELEGAPESPNVGDLLAVLGPQVEDALRSNRLDRVLKIVATLVRLEQSVPEGSARRNYGIALRRMYTKPLLKGLASLLSEPKLEADAVLALQRGGADAVELLLDQLITAPALSERRGIFDALRQANAGREQLIPLLRHNKWYVVRNVAELIGEMGMQTAVAELAECLGHQDERVRKAVALALTKIGTASTSEPLRRALRDKSPEVRVQVAVGVGVGGRRTTGLAMPLVVALQDEEDETVQRELILALGRIGTPDAVQALIKVAQPSGRLFGRKPTPLRLAAVEALRLAGTAPALGTLEGLGGDGDKLVRTAAQAAVWELTQKKKKR